MDLYKILWDAFALENRSISELIEISSRIDSEMSKDGFLLGSNEDLSVIASTIVALMNGKSTATIGKKLEDSISGLIVEKNLNMVEMNDGKKLYEQLQKKELPGTYKVRIINNGFKFDLVAANGELLATSEVYSTLDSCKNGIVTVRKNADACIEDQTEDKFESVKNPKYEMYKDRNEEYRFKLKSANGQIIMVSQGYSNKNDCLSAIEKIKKSADSSDVEKM